MQKEIILTPEELYYLGRFLQARYIDYAYVAALNDINQNFSLFETETKASLVSSGILVEDFGGNVEIDQDIAAILKPIFFGEIETSIDICNIGESNSVDVFKFHFYDGIITYVTGMNGKLVIKLTDQIEIQEKLNSLISANYSAENEKVETIDKSKITRVIAFKKIVVGTTSMVKTYIEAAGIYYQEIDEQIESVTKEQFISDSFNIVKGV